MTDDQILMKVADWLTTVTGLLFIIGDQSGDMPELPYGMVRLLSDAAVREQPQGVDYEDTASDEVTATIALEYEWFFSVHVYGENPTQYLKKVTLAHHLNQVTEPLAPDLVIHEVSRIRNLPEYIGEKMEPRAQMDFIVRGVISDGFSIDVVEEYSITVDRMEDNPV